MKRIMLSLALLALGACAPQVQTGEQVILPPDDASTIIPLPYDGTSTVIPVPGPDLAPANTVTYACDGGQSVTVTYLGSSTAQLFWQGNRLTLSQTESGSGARYTDGFYTWVTRGNQGFLEQNGLNQPQIVVANNCVARP